MAELAAGKVRITIGHPRFHLGYRLAGTIPELAPRRDMLGKAPAEFAALYTALLEERGGVEQLTQRFAAVAAEARSAALVLLCFEDLRKPDVFCHRRVFAEWWEAQTGAVIEEIAEPA